MSTNLQLKDCESKKIERRRKPSPLNDLALKHPINGSDLGSGCHYVQDNLYCRRPSMIQYDLVCTDGQLSLSNPEGLLRQFTFFIDSWLRNNQKRTRVRTSQYSKALDMILANLRLAQLQGNQLLTPLRKVSSKENNPESIGYTITREVLNYLSDRGLITLVIGRSNEYQNACSWCEPTSQLITWFEGHSIKTLLHYNAELVLVRENVGSKKVKVNIPKRDKAKAKRLELPVVNYNKLWVEHSATLDGRYIHPYTKRLFNDSINYGGRFYGSFQGLPKVDRERVLIDGLPTIEPDYSALHLSILYANEGIQLKATDYPYSIEGYDVKTVKSVMLRFLNIENKGALKSCITKSAKPEIKELFADWSSKNITNNRYIAHGVNLKQLRKPKALEGFIKNIPEGTNGGELIAAIEKKHAAVAHNFGTKRIGVRLQKQDSEIMAAVLNNLSLQGKPVLPIHDSIRCKVSDQYQAITTMKNEYKRITGYDIVVKF